MLQRSTVGSKCPRRTVLAHSLGVNPDHGVHALLSQPFQDQQRHVFNATIAFDLRPAAPALCHRADCSDLEPSEHPSAQKFREACIRCSLLRPDPAQRTWLEEVRDNLIARIAEAEREGWLGEVEGLRVSLAGAEEKLAQLDRRSPTPTPVNLGIPTIPEAR